jgi:hypothetical protein
MSKIISLIIIMIICSVFPLNAGISSTNGYFMVGGNHVLLDDLDKALNDSFYTDFTHNMTSLGGGAHIAINRIIIGGEGHVLFCKEEEARVPFFGTPYNANLSAAYGLFNIGYIVFQRGNLNVYPLFGLGGGSISIQMVRRYSPSFDDVMRAPGYSSELSTSCFLLNLGAGTDFLLKIKEGGTKDIGLTLGLRLGGTVAIINGTWDIGGQDVSSGPGVGITGPYIRISLGIGSQDSQ